MDQYISKFIFKERVSNIEYNDDVEMVFVELPKFQKEEEEELTTIQDKWIYFMKKVDDLGVEPDRKSVV